MKTLIALLVLAPVLAQPLIVRADEAGTSKMNFLIARDEFRDVLHKNTGLRLGHVQSAAGKIAADVGLGAIVATAAAIGTAAAGGRPSGIAFVAATVATPIFGLKGSLKSARTETTGRAVARGLMTKDTAHQWQRAGLISAKWRR